MTSKNVYNASATLGQILITMQGFSCIAVAIGCLVTGSTLLGSSQGERIIGRVKGTECLDDIGRCAITVTYVMGGKRYQSTFETAKTLNYAKNDAISILVNPETPHVAIEDLPWQHMGATLIAAAICTAASAYYAMHLVSQRKNIAALAGVFGFVSAIVN
jgi:hypothetical protein